MEQPTSDTQPLLAPSIFDANSPNSYTERSADKVAPVSDSSSISSTDIETISFSFPNIITECSKLSKLAFPCVSSSVLNYASKFTISLMVGHIGPTELAACTLAVMFSNVLGYSLCYGLTTAMDTLCSQAVTGSSDRRYAGIILQRSILINTTLMIPVVFLWIFASPILQALGQDPKLSDMAGSFILYLLPAVPANLIWNALAKFLQAQGKMNPPFYILMCTFPLNVLLQYLLTWYEPTSIGYLGAPLGSAITDWVAMFGLIVYVTFVDGYQCWHPWTLEAFAKWKQYLMLALPGLFMMCAEWWSFEAVALLAGLFGETVLAAQSVILITCSLFFQLFLGISIANSNRVGNFLGAGRAKAAKFSAYTSVGFTMALATINGIVLFSVRNVWGYLFTNDPDVVAIVASVLPIAALFQVGDGGGCVSGGILRGCGKQKIGAYANLIGYYIIGLPLGAALTFKPLNLQLIGIWTGLAIALFVTLFFQFGYIHYKVDWEMEVANARERVNAGVNVEFDVEEGEDTESLIHSVSPE